MTIFRSFTAEEISALKLHGLDTDGPSQLSDAFVSGLRFKAVPPLAAPVAAPAAEKVYEQALLAVLEAVRDYLPPDGISVHKAMHRIIGLVDPWPTAPVAAAVPDVGDYVLATKYTDGDPGDAWALGFYDGVRGGRHYVKDSQGRQIRGNGYRRVAAIRPDVGRWLMEVAAPHLERCPPGTVNLWAMLTPSAFDLARNRFHDFARAIERHHGIKGEA